MAEQSEKSEKKGENQSVDDYINQFLVLPLEEKPMKSLKVKRIAKKQENSSFEYSCSEVHSSDFEEQSDIGVKKSSLHNFQKHFVTTIRQNVKIKWANNDCPYMLAAREIWETFTNSPKYTKQFVSLILGQSRNVIDKTHLEKYDLLECFNKYGEQNYILAQNQLRNHVLETFQNVSRSKIMIQRRIAKKEEFSKYFFKLLTEIQEGKMHKRLPKKRLREKRESKK